MPETKTTKVCPLCAETIQAAAKVCPHCRSWQKKWTLQNPQVAQAIYIAIMVFGMAGMCALFEKMLGPKKQFAEYRNEIQVVNSQFSQRISGSNVWNTVVGTLTNSCDVGWKDVGVEAQFFDKAGTLIDAITVNAGDYRGIVILPHGEAAFKIERQASHPAADYQTNQITVRWAKDIHAMFP